MANKKMTKKERQMEQYKKIAAFGVAVASLIFFAVVASEYGATA
jgi:pheromone shutdown protein TraB